MRRLYWSDVTRGRDDLGMTLVEVLVALAIMGAVVASVISLISQNTRFLAAAEDRLLAGIAVDNAMIETLARREPLQIGEEALESTIAGRTAPLRRKVIETGVDGVLRVEIVAFDSAGRQALARAVTIRREAP